VEGNYHKTLQHISVCFSLCVKFIRGLLGECHCGEYGASVTESKSVIKKLCGFVLQRYTNVHIKLVLPAACGTYCLPTKYLTTLLLAMFLRDILLFSYLLNVSTFLGYILNLL
jgi:hypothetical protein